MTRKHNDQGEKARMDLRDGCIYRLPNGRELVALGSQKRTTLLFEVGEPDKIQYALNAAGRLTFQGRLTAWSVADLVDTGRTDNDSRGVAEGFQIREHASSNS
jgi:hypothetical protein